MAAFAHHHLLAWGYVLGTYEDKPSSIEMAAALAGMVVWGTLLHSAGCVINDICDVEFDRQVGELLHTFVFMKPKLKSDRTH